MSVEGQDHRETPPRRSPVVQTAPGTLRARADGRLRQVAADRGLLWDPLPKAVPTAMTQLIDTVEDLTAGLGIQGRRWLAAVLAVLSEDVEATADTAGRDLRSEPGTAIAVPVVAESVGVLAGRRRHGDPPWVLPTGAIRAGETPAQAAMRTCKEQTGSCPVLDLLSRQAPRMRRCPGAGEIAGCVTRSHAGVRSR